MAKIVKAVAKPRRRNRAAQDATLINIRALKRAVARLTVRVATLERVVRVLYK